MKRSIYSLCLACTLLLEAGRETHAQEGFVEVLKERLTAYYNKNLPVKVHLFFNQPAYYPGDTAYFHVSFLGAEGLRGIAGRQILHVMLTDDKNRVILRQQIVVRDGSGFNQLAIPASATSGMYTVTAYSDWMLNFDRSLICRVMLPVVTDRDQMVQQRDMTAFYPEGGHLVSRVSNKVVMTGIPGTRTSIVTTQGTEVANCTPDSTGLGFFYLTPAPEEKYHTVVQGVRVSLPEVSDIGVNMLLTHVASSNTLRVILQAGQAAFQAGERNAYLIVSAQGTAYYSAAVTFEGTQNNIISIPLANIPAGIARATVFRSNGTVLAERLFFVEGAAPAQVSIVHDDFYTTRETVKIKLHVGDTRGPVKANLRVRVYQDDLFPGQRCLLVRHPLHLMGEIPVTAYGRYGQASSAAFDNFLITQQQKVFSWDDVWNNANDPKEHSFRRSLHFSGRAYMKNSSEPLPDSTHVTFFLQNDVMTYAIYPKPDGTFSFPLLNDFTGEDKVYYRVEVKGVTRNDIIVSLATEEMGANLPESPSVYKTSDSTSRYAVFAAQKKIIDQAYGFVQRQRQQHYEKINPHSFLEEEIFDADVTINIRDYLLFPDMEETLREIIPYVQHRWREKQHVVRVYIKDLEVLAEEDPLYVIDGVLTDNTDYFMSLKPEEVASIKVVCTMEKLRTFGAVGKNGVILIETTVPGNARHVPVSDHSISISGITPPGPLPQGISPAADKRRPYLQACLYWNPEVTTDAAGDADISFYTSDGAGKYRVEIDGITSDGRPLQAAESFDLVFEPTVARER